MTNRTSPRALDNATALHNPEDELIRLLKLQPDILTRHPDLLPLLQVPHASGMATSLIERQVGVLRENLRASEKRLRQLMDIARDNERLAGSRHRIAINLLGAHDLEDVISIVLDELRGELKAEFAEIRLIASDSRQHEHPCGLFVEPDAPGLNAFSTMLRHRNPVCGGSSEEQRCFLFGDTAAEVNSLAVIPLVAGAELGLLGLGSRNESRFRAGMATDFLTQVGELVSAALAVHLE